MHFTNDILCLSDRSNCSWSSPAANKTLGTSLGAPKENYDINYCQMECWDNPNCHSVSFGIPGTEEERTCLSHGAGADLIDSALFNFYAISCDSGRG